VPVWVGASTLWWLPLSAELHDAMIATAIVVTKTLEARIREWRIGRTIASSRGRSGSRRWQLPCAL
jgi:hypothetical protein